ncbi:MAG: extracellular solute-binding protein, partial [Thaumarchaeota archaeon]|nr:extracellular solute-binding protein [Nitrososphaerota archaeon]
EDLTARYDLLVVDHPFMGTVAKTGCLRPLDALLSESSLAGQAKRSVGPSYGSYTLAGHQWCLAVDAAAQVSAYRPNLLGHPPRDWRRVMELAEGTKTGGPRVAMPLIPTDAYASFLSLCANRGEPAFRGSQIVSREVAVEVLLFMQRLAEALHPVSFKVNPPQLLDMMSETDEVFYSPLLFGYSNYSRTRQGKPLIAYADIPSAGQGPVGSLLGGAGIGVSAQSAHPQDAARLAEWVCGSEMQRGVYFTAGGQPGNSVAWDDESVNGQAHNFFRRTKATMDGSYMRPRYAGYVGLQTRLGEIVHRCLVSGEDPRKTYDEMNSAFQATAPGRAPGAPAGPSGSSSHPDVRAPP